MYPSLMLLAVLMAPATAFAPKVRSVRQIFSPLSMVSPDSLRQEAARMRLEAEQMDWELTVSKVKALQQKITKLARLPDAETRLEDAEQELERLQVKLEQYAGSHELLQELTDWKPEIKMTTVSSTASLPSTSRTEQMETASSTATTTELETEPSTVATRTATLVQDPPTTVVDEADESDAELAGFDQVDLDLYVPVAKDIEAIMPNATIDELLNVFREAPELQEHFQSKIAQLLVAPMQEMQKLDHLQTQYLESTSTTEKQQLKREIDALTSVLDKEGPFTYSESIYLDTIPVLTDEMLQKRVAAIQSLPIILQTLYKRRYNLENTDSIELAVQLDHYEDQLQLLEQVNLVTPLTPELKDEVYASVDVLPAAVRDQLAKGFGMDVNNYDNTALAEKFIQGDNNDWGTPLRDLVTNSQTSDMSDIEFVDRSRFVSEFYPSVARLEADYPSERQVDDLSRVMFNKREFMMTSKPERVTGGWYIRGDNLISEDEGGVALLSRIDQRLRENGTDFGLEYFYINDPSPTSDEDAEREYERSPVFLVTKKNYSVMYNSANPLVKTAISALGLASIAIFSVGICGLEPQLLDKVDEAKAAATVSGGAADLSWLVDIVVQCGASLLAIQSAHEIGHRVVAWRDNVKVGFPTILPSLQLGCMGTITPLQSPLPSIKSMFDFGISGPLFGIAASLFLFLQGLSLTATTDLSQIAYLPAIPADLLKSSALGGGLTEFFLGRGTVSMGLTDVVALHPIAIAGFVGLLTNALALLPLGNTDGGRIAVAMFGRRGAYIVNAFTSSLLCLAGIFGLDDNGAMLTYTLFAIIWQREQEGPTRNEAEILDIPRCLVGLSAAFVVALILLPM